MLFFSQVWQCASDGSSSHKRSQFELLAELEHDAGVSENLHHQRMKYVHKINNQGLLIVLIHTEEINVFLLFR